jgi:hypothetical protein
MATFDPGLSDLRREQRLRETERWRHESLYVAWALRELRAATSPADLYRWHKRLLERFAEVQDWATGTRQELARMRSERSRSNAVVQELKAQRHAAKAILGLYRCLGDAAAWLLLGWRRAEITALGTGIRVERLPDDERGRQAEIEEIEWLWHARGVLAIHTALTSCIRFGDLISIESWRPRVYRLSEIKAARDSRPDARHQKQLDRLAELTKILNREQWHHELAAPVDCPVQIRTHHEHLGMLLRTARQETFASAEVEPGVHITAIDDSDPGGIGPDISGVWASAMARVEWASPTGEGPEQRGSSTPFRMIRDRRFSFPGLAPLSIFPFDSATVGQLMAGPLRFHVIIHLPELEARLHSRGIEACASRGREAEDTFLKILDQDREIAIPAPIAETLTIELMTMDTVADTIQWAVEDPDARRARAESALAFNFANEAAIWSA